MDLPAADRAPLAEVVPGAVEPKCTAAGEQTDRQGDYVRPFLGPQIARFVTHMTARFDALHNRNGLGFAAGVPLPI